MTSEPRPPESGGRQRSGERPRQSAGQQYADRCYRSPAAMAGGAALLAVGLWLGGEVVLNGAGHTRWTALAVLVLGVPLVTAFTLRPAVFAGDRQLRVRNPFRTITVPWGAVESVRAGYSSEVVAGGTTYQLWAIPVSLRARKRATRHNERIASGRPAPRGGFLGLGAAPVVGETDTAGKRAPSDRTIDELRELAERHAEASPGSVTVRWSWEFLTPALLGAVATAALLLMR